MQLYIVCYKMETGANITIGKVLILGADKDDAVSRVCFHLKLTSSECQFRIEKVKPSIFTLEKSRVIKKRVIDPNSPAIGGSRGMSNSLYAVSIDSEVWAGDEVCAVKAIAFHSMDYAQGKQQARTDISVFDLQINETTPPTKGLATPDIEKQAIFKSTRVFNGGACSPK